jgi:hypothetical protein
MRGVKVAKEQGKVEAVSLFRAASIEAHFSASY